MYVYVYMCICVYVYIYIYIYIYTYVPGGSWWEGAAGSAAASGVGYQAGVQH